MRRIKLIVLVVLVMAVLVASAAPALARGSNSPPRQVKKCQNGGWENFDFKNKARCIKHVERNFG